MLWLVIETDGELIDERVEIVDILAANWEGKENEGRVFVME
jgi:hypothetical protein